MKRKTLFVIILFLNFNSYAQIDFYELGLGTSKNKNSTTIVEKSHETTLFNHNGNAKAYISFSDLAIIYLWNGIPAAFLENSGNDVCVIGFNGKFLGWYENGILYDKEGYPAGAKEGAVNMYTNREPLKNSKRRTPSKSYTSRIPSYKPSLKSTWRRGGLVELLYSGKSHSYY